MVVDERSFPYKKPWILVDQIEGYKAGERIVALKNISCSDFFLMGHFPDQSLYPGVLLLEGILQSAALLLDPDCKKDMTLTGIRSKFLRPVVPGQAVRYVVEASAHPDGGITVSAAGSVDNQTVVSALLHYEEGAYASE